MTLFTPTQTTHGSAAGADNRSNKRDERWIIDAAYDLPDGVYIARDTEVLDEIYEMRYEVYFAECGRVLPGIDHERRMLRDEDMQDAFVLYVRKDGVIAGTVRIDVPRAQIPGYLQEWYGTEQFHGFSASHLCFVSKLMIAPSYRRSSVLIELVEACYRIARHHGARFAFCGASPHLVQLYERLGFQRYKSNLQITGIGLQIALVCLLEDLGHFHAIRSPLRSVAREYPSCTKTRNWFRRTFPRAVGHTNESLIDQEWLASYVESQLDLPAVPALQGLTREQAVRLLTSGMIYRSPAGEAVMSPGQVAYDLCFILSGEVVVEDVAGMHKVVGPGSTLGVTSFLEQSPRRMAAQAKTNVELISLTPGAVRRAFGEDEDSLRRFLVNLRVQLRTNQEETEATAA